MKAKALEMKARVRQLLIDHEYINMRAIQQMIKLSSGSIYRIIRLLREDGLGIYSTRNGYTLAEYATHRNDTLFMRRINGRRISDFIAATAAAPHIKKRWKGISQEKEITGLLSDFTNNDFNKLLSNRATLERHVNLGI